jgi:chromate transporter
MDIWLFFWLFLKASLFSTGGMGNLPSLHADLLARHCATEREFAESLVIGQISPGPNGLWVISLGYFTRGVIGSLLALLAIVLPPLLVLWVEKIYRRVQDHPAVEGFMRGLSLAVAAIFAVVMIGFLRSQPDGPVGVLIAVAAICLGLVRRIPVIAIIALAGIVGIVLR